MMRVMNDGAVLHVFFYRIPTCSCLELVFIYFACLAVTLTITSTDMYIIVGLNVLYILVI